jgi:hypothetical protein
MADRREIEMGSLSLVSPVHAGAPRGHVESVSTNQRPKEPPVFFTRAELNTILRVYGRHVAEGEWRDYAMGAFKESCVFAVFRRTAEVALYRIEKHPKLARKQGAFRVVTATGLILKRGHDLEQVLSVFDKRNLRLID